MISKEIKNWAIFINLSPLLCFAWPYLGLLAIFVTWLIKKGENEFLDQNLKNSLNSQLTWSLISVVFLIIAAIGLFLIAYLPQTHPIVFIINTAGGYIGLIVAAVAPSIYGIIGAIKASKGEVYPYPVKIRFFK
jgi:uncharacterized Tic20 family protein